MGILNKLPIRLPILRDPRTVYRAYIMTDKGRHFFVYVKNEKTNESEILYNERDFIMPEDPVFTNNGVRGRVELYGSTVSFKEIIPVDEPELVEDPKDTYKKVEIPDRFKGKKIPKIEKPYGTSWG